MSKEKAISLYLNTDSKKDTIAYILGVPRSQVREWLRGLTKADKFKGGQQEMFDKPVEIKFFGGAKPSDAQDKDDVPLSEVAIPKLHNATAQETLDDLRRMAEANPEQVIGRNYYRVHGKYSESAWSQYWGTFHEFKRQAGIVLTRQQHNLEKQIAKHASVGHYRDMNDERRSYGDAYDKPTSKRFKQVLVAADMHDKNVDPFYLDVLLDTCKRVQPDVICLAGDIFDNPEFGRYTVDPRQWDVVGRIKFVHDNILRPMREACPNSQIDFVEGNHELRLCKHLADATPALRAVLSDLHGMTISKLFGLDQFGINYIAKGDISAYNLSDIHKEVKKSYKNYWDCFIVHHETEGANLGMPGINGHHHKTVIQSKYSELYGAYNWIQIAGGHKLDAEYTHPKWQLGFAIATCDTLTKQTVFDTITFSENFAVVGGVYYERSNLDTNKIL